MQAQVKSMIGVPTRVLMLSNLRIIETVKDKEDKMEG